jgi:hypothetical protein
MAGAIGSRKKQDWEMAQGGWTKKGDDLDYGNHRLSVIK